MAGKRYETLIERRRHLICGIVQGVGFRPFVYRLAHENGLSGWVRNTPAGVEIETQGNSSALAVFEEALATRLPPLAMITSHIKEDIPPGSDNTFIILASSGGEPSIQIAPDSAVCPDCLHELFDPADRRYRYPFITCTNCGPRYSIITGIPYDRPKTTLAHFPLCPDCLKEYHDPANRRFHAQPIACPACGPQVGLVAQDGQSLAAGYNAVMQAIERLKNGQILAVKGIGGYHLAVDAFNQKAVERLRTLKQRDQKPFAVMVADLDAARCLALMDQTEERLLTSPESPIVIVRKRPECRLPEALAPSNGWIGLMLPYAPLQHLLIRNNFPALVMTSGNLSDEPVAFRDDDALSRLAGIADAFLLHDRPIHIRSDDSVMRVFRGQPLFYRRARGYAPRAVRLPFSCPPLLALGAELKSAVCLADRQLAFLSQHIGDLQNDTTYDSFRHTIRHLSEVLEIRPRAVACDLHPDYLSSRFAEEFDLPLFRVQHHHAHLAACMAENGLQGTAIGVILDGTGYGGDGTIWGGEFLLGGYDGYQRAAHFKPAALPGGDAAVREPWRMALSYLYGTMGPAVFDSGLAILQGVDEGQRRLLASMLQRGINSPLTSSCGRLFDAVAALLGVRHLVSYDGQAAIELEALAEMAPTADDKPYSYIIAKQPEKPHQLDFYSLFPQMLADLRAGIPCPVIARNFHVTVAAAVVEVCGMIRSSSGVEQVVLSGGVFQNRLLSEMIYSALEANGHIVFCHRLAPPNDGGIALGQAAIAAHAIKKGF